jgi:hypothetical protein
MLISKRKFRHYFDAHPIMVVSKYLLKEVSKAQRQKEESQNGLWS